MRLVFSLLILVISLASNAQQISGMATDADGKPLNGATVSLLKDTGRAILKYTVTKEGAYGFENVKPGKYRVSASYVGFTPAVSPVFELGSDAVSVPQVKLAKAAAQMNAVTVTATKPIVEVKADKTILNVEGTINSVGSDALELLRKSPGVLVDKDENLSVNGKNGVQVYIDGRPTPLSGQDLSNYLKSIQSSNIEAIEIITNPSAKYEAAGNAGIINIRLKKNKSLGTNGSVNAGMNVGTYPKYNAGIALNHRNKTVNIFGNYSFNEGKNISTTDLYRTTSQDTLFDQHGTQKAKMLGHNYKVGADYFINKMNVLGVMVNGTFASPEFTSHSRTPISYIPTGVVDRILVANNNSDMKRNNINANLNYSYTNPDGRSLTVNLDHGYYDINTNQLQPNYYFDPSGLTLLRTVTTRTISPTNIYINSLKVDWEQNFMKGKLGYGGKLSLIKTDNNFQSYDVNGSSEILNTEKSNLFDYKENINAGYVNYNRQFKGIMIQAGVRVENTVSKGTSLGAASGSKPETFKRPYTDVFPSAAITFNKNPMSQFGITYSKRIDRPAYQDLNPFEFKLDEYTFQKGNVNLRPQYTNSIGISHTYKYRLNTSLNYSHVKDIFAQWIDTTQKSKAFISKKNLNTQDIISFNISYPYQYKSYTVFANLSSNYSMYKADFGPGRKVDLNAFGMTLYAQNSLKFGKTKTWAGELTGFYVAPTIQQGAFRSEALWSVDGGISKQLWKNKATIKASYSDIFNSLHFTGKQEFAGQLTRVKAHWESQQIKLNFVYRFGSAQVKAARNRNTGAEDETKRTQGGNGLGVGQQ